MTKPFLAALAGQRQPRPPAWLMRQAGRYLPEYRELRTQAPTFLDFCYTPKLAVEATLQPIRRFGFDAAILFSDILVMPDALGQSVSFEAGEGPRLAAVESAEDFAKLREAPDWTRLAPVFEAVAAVKAALPRETALIGFCGAPWTVASYMIAGRGTPDQAPARLFAYRHPEIVRRADRPPRRRLRRLPEPAGRSRRGSGAGVRFLVGRAAGGGIRALVRAPGSPACRRLQGEMSANPGHRLSTRGGDAPWPLRRDRGARRDRSRHRRRPQGRGGDAAGARWRCKAISIRWR